MSIEILLPYLELDKQNRETMFVISDFDWQTYEQLLVKLEDSNSYRLSYFGRILEIMAPSERHETVAENIGGLLDIFLEIKEIDFWRKGSTTIKNKNKLAGKEPDKSYCFNTKKNIPDLAIEVIYTSGNLDVLEIYQKLEVKEVWLWKNNKISIYSLVQGEYRKQENSLLLPGLNIALIEKLCVAENTRLAMKEFRAYYS